MGSARGLDLEPLRELGLSERELQIYLQLLRQGPSKAGALIRATNIPNSVMHLTLGRLLGRGIVSYVVRGKTRVFTAASPRRLLEIADERRHQLSELVPHLLSLRAPADIPQAEVYEGVSGLQNMCFAFIEGVSPGDEYLFFGFASENKDFEDDVYGFYREFTRVRIDRGLVLRGMAHESMREIFKRYRWPHRNVRFVGFPILQNISICRDKVIIVPWTETRTSFMITSRGFADNLRGYFELLWSTSAAPVDR